MVGDPADISDSTAVSRTSILILSRLAAMPPDPGAEHHQGPSETHCRHKGKGGAAVVRRIGYHDLEKGWVGQDSTDERGGPNRSSGVRVGRPLHRETHYRRGVLLLSTARGLVEIFHFGEEVSRYPSEGRGHIPLLGEDHTEGQILRYCCLTLIPWLCQYSIFCVLPRGHRRRQHRVCALPGRSPPIRRVSPHVELSQGIERPEVLMIAHAVDVRRNRTTKRYNAECMGPLRR